MTTCRAPNGPDHRYQCRCHELLGGDFGFLPTGSCLGEVSIKDRPGWKEDNSKAPEAVPLICEGCGSKENITRTLEWDLCPGCLDQLRLEHKHYAEARRAQQ